MRQIAIGLLLLIPVGCATHRTSATRALLQTERADLDGTYELTATVTEQNVTRSSSHPITHRVTGRFRFSEGRLVELDNDYSTPCRVEDSGPAAPMRSMDPHVIRATCPDFTMTITLDRGEALQSHHVTLRVRVVDTIERRGDCAVRNSEGQCIEWEWILSSEPRWRSPPVRITKQAEHGEPRSARGEVRMNGYSRKISYLIPGPTGSRDCLVLGR